MFLKCCSGKDKVSPTDDTVEDIRNSLYKKEKLSSQKDLREDSKEEGVTWQLLSRIQDRLCLYLYTITIAILIMVFLLALYGFV